MYRAQSDLKTVLQSISHILFPGEADVEITIDSRGAEDDTPLHVFVWRNDLENVRLLLKNGADPNAIGDMSQTPLHVAISRENPDIIDALLQSGASPHIRSEFGQTALEEARELGGKIYDLVRRYATR